MKKRVKGKKQNSFFHNNLFVILLILFIMTLIAVGYLLSVGSLPQLSPGEGVENVESPLLGVVVLGVVIILLIILMLFVVFSKKERLENN